VRQSVVGVTHRLAPLAVETFLVLFGVVFSIVFPAPIIAALATMMLPAAERATQILATRVAGMRQKADPAVKAENRAVPQLRTIAQDGIQRALILPNKRKGAVVLVPLFAKRENFGDRYDKSARFSVKMSSGFCISSSYSLDAKASRRRARIFSCSSTEDRAANATNRSTR
jgi:hypothetical protein